MACRSAADYDPLPAAKTTPFRETPSVFLPKMAQELPTVE
jgi:hypothetical protein